MAMDRVMIGQKSIYGVLDLARPVGADSSRPFLAFFPPECGVGCLWNEDHVIYYQTRYLNSYL